MMRAAVSNALTGIGKDFLTLIFSGWGDVSARLGSGVDCVHYLPIAVLPIARLGRRIRKVTVNTQEELGQFTTLLEQTFQGARVVKAYGMEDYEKSACVRSRSAYSTSSLNPPASGPWQAQSWKPWVGSRLHSSYFTAALGSYDSPWTRAPSLPSSQHYCSRMNP